MTVDLWHTFAKTLVPSAYDKTAAADRRKAMETALNIPSLQADYWFESGSWSHGTALAGASDVDYMAWASASRPSRPSSALTAFRAALTDAHWCIDEVAVSSPAVKVRFFSPPHFEVVPAWYSKMVGDEYVYLIPGPGDEWVESAPKAHMRLVNEQNDRLGKQLKPLVRLLKQWKVTVGAPVSSFWLEMRAAEYAQFETVLLLDIDLPRLMRRLIANEVRSMNDPLGLVTRIAAVSSDENRRITLGLLQKAERRLTEAAELEGDPAKNYEYWDRMADVFGSTFPYPFW